MNERYHRMIELIEDIKEKSVERDRLMERLEYAVDHEIQRDLDEEHGLVKGDVKTDSSNCGKVKHS